MLFNSYEFIFLFLPLTAAGFFLIGRWSRVAAASFLALASMTFYAWWDSRYVWLLFGSAALNFTVGRALVAVDPALHRRRRGLLALGVAGDLAILGWYKYANFFIDNLNAATGASVTLQTIILPLGISFFTFTQIAFLVDAYRGEAREYNPVHYLLFVSFFPHLIAGPILHHKEMMPQFNRPETYRFDLAVVAPGVVVFVIGLFKKTGIADNIAPFATSVFTTAANGNNLDFFAAWSGALAYTFQLYFDFSGYSDMAIGAALIFGIQLPFNFASPYKAASIVEFWRRWHITLSRFLRDYLYIPLGGNRLGLKRTYVNILIVMVLGGLWHGAAWTFVAWGALHGAYLLVNHVWQQINPAPARPPGPHLIAWLLTFLAVVVAWVIFRAPDMATVVAMLRGMVGLNGFVLGEHHRAYFGPLADFLQVLGIRFDTSVRFSFISAVWIAASFLIVLALPNTQQWVGLQSYAGWVPHWRPTVASGAAIGALAALSISLISGASEFLYFNF